MTCRERPLAESYVDTRSFSTENIEDRLRRLMVRMGVPAESIGDDPGQLETGGNESSQ